MRDITLSKDKRGWLVTVVRLLFVPIAIGYGIWALGRADDVLEAVLILAAMIFTFAVHVYTYRHEKNPFEVAVTKLKERFRRRHYR